jgi:hypothetical protein
MVFAKDSRVVCAMKANSYPVAISKMWRPGPRLIPRDLRTIFTKMGQPWKSDEGDFR